MYLGAIEAGGTKFVCAVGGSDGEVYEKIKFATTNPQETIGKIVEFFKPYKLAAIGIGSFGPIDLDKNSATYGYITSTPKPYWRNFNFVGEINKYFHVPIRFDTDVNAAALAEQLWGAAKGLSSCIYITVGTGIGVGALVEGKLLHGLAHPEMGHIIIQRHPDDNFVGNCPFHNDCLEGMASGPAIEKRWGKKGDELTDCKEVWELEAFYLAQAIANYILILSPQKVILGGGVMKQQQLFPNIRQKVIELLNGYIQHDVILHHLEEYIVPPGLGENSGICGALALAKQAIDS
jgi:fructokinase